MSYSVRSDSNGDLWVEFENFSNKTISQWLGKATFLTNVYKALETDNFLIGLEYEYLGETKKIILPRSDLKKGELLKYADNITMDTYSHVLDDMGKEAAEKLEAGLQAIIV